MPGALRLVAIAAAIFAGVALVAHSTAGASRQGVVNHGPGTHPHKMYRRAQDGEVQSIMNAIAVRAVAKPHGTLTVVSTVVGRPPKVGNYNDIMKAIMVRADASRSGSGGKTKTITVTSTLSLDGADLSAILPILKSMLGGSDNPLMIRSSTTPSPTHPAPTHQAPTHHAPTPDPTGNQSCGVSRMTFGTLVIEVSDGGACGSGSNTDDTVTMTGVVVDTQSNDSSSSDLDGASPEPTSAPAPTPINARPVMGELGYGIFDTPTGFPLVCSAGASRLASPPSSQSENEAPSL